MFEKASVYMTIKNTILDNNLEALFLKGIFGLEKESQRIREDGVIADTDHPDEFGDRSFHPYIQTDFAESQLELVTPPVDTVEGVMDWLAAIHDVVLGTLPEDEYMLPYSLPPIMPDDEDIQVAKLITEEDVAYREYLVKVYGKKKQMMSGIHYNFEFHPDFIKALFKQQTNFTDFRKYQSRVYLKLAHNFLRYQWVLTYLYGCSIEVEDQHFQDNDLPSDIPSRLMRSIRSSKYGYVNEDDVKISFETMEEYVEDIERMVAEGKLIAEKEFYSTIRFRGGGDAREILENGISYLEFRLFDLNPFAPYGILADDIKVIHYFFMYLIWKEEEAHGDEWELGKMMNHVTSFEDPLAKSAYFDEGLEILHGMKEMLETLGAKADAIALVEEKIAEFHYPERTLSGKLATMHHDGTDLLKWGIQKAKENKALSLERPYLLTGFEDMELSTQILLFDAIQKGLEIDLLDRSDQFLSLKYDDHIEYVKNGNMSAKDTYIAPLIMENKVVTKKILARHGFSVPKSSEYHKIEDAWADYQLFAKKAFVIKPKSTNYGLGITIFREGAKEASFKEAVEIAFSEDSTILIEDFVVGTEYRFFVIGDQTKAVLLRVPANVTGDGERTIRELVEEKNSNPLRGVNHRTPLEKIQLGKIERLTLEEQRHDFDSIPAKDELVYLRDNSNVSTGGDSIDFTDRVHESYKQIAAEMTGHLGANIAGIDMMIVDYNEPANHDEANYGVIEANFNPMMMMHIYPYQGESRRLTLDILDLLFPELKLETGTRGNDV